MKQQTTKDCAIDYENPWLCQGTTFTTNDIGDQFGFVYRITNLQSGKQYIGRKYFYQKRKPRGGGRRVTSESNWKKYYGSCPELTADIKSIGKEAFKRELSSVHATVGKTNYEETRQLFINNVLTEKLSDGTPAYYNSNILGRYYRKDYFAYDTEV